MIVGSVQTPAEGKSYTGQPCGDGGTFLNAAVVPLSSCLLCLCHSMALKSGEERLKEMEAEMAL